MGGGGHVSTPAQPEHVGRRLGSQFDQQTVPDTGLGIQCGLDGCRQGEVILFGSWADVLEHVACAPAAIATHFRDQNPRSDLAPWSHPAGRYRQFPTPWWIVCPVGELEQLGPSTSPGSSKSQVGVLAPLTR